MQKITLDGQAYELAERWADVDPERLPELLQLVYFAPDAPERLQELLRLALNIRPKTWRKMMQNHFSAKRSKKVRQANAVVLHTLYSQLRWMRSEPIHQAPFPFLELDNGGRLLLPESDFLTMSFGELSDGYMHFLVWLRQLVAGDAHLDLLVATLCRPGRGGDYQAAADWNGDHREPYNEFTARERASSLASLEPGRKMAILLFFAGNVQRVLERYKIFGGEEAGEAGDPEQYPGQAWIKNQHLLAEKGIFGNLAETKAANLHDVLIFLEEHRADMLAELERRKQSEQ